MKYHFLFDYDGVLIHKLDFAQSLAERHGIEVRLIRSFFIQYLQKSLRGEIDMILTLEKHLDDFKWTGSAKSLFDAIYVENIKPNTQLIAFIRDKLKGSFSCDIATNQDHHRYKVIEKEPISQELFDQVFSSSEMGVAKPEKEYFEKIYAILQEKDPILKKERIIFIDDLKENVNSAKQFGFESHVYQTQEAFEHFLATLIPSLSQ